MKNIVKVIKDITLNKKGAIKRNTMQGLSVAVFALVIGYGVYTAYNNSPAYNPARRAIFNGEGRNLSANSIDTDSVALKTSDAIPMDMRNEYGEFGKNSGKGGSSVRSRISKNEEEFEKARAYMEAQKSGVAGTQGSEAAVVANGVAQGADFEQEAPALAEQDRVRSSFNNSGRNAGAAYMVGEQGSANTNDSKYTNKNKQNPTVVNKLAASGSTGSSFGGSSGSSGASSGMGGGESYGASNRYKDGSSKALPETNVASAKNGNSFTLGRGGEMGGNNVADAGGNAAGGGTRDGDSNTKGDINIAYAHSQHAAKAVITPGGKVTAMAEAAAAFDGSDDRGGSGSEINGTQIVDPGARGLNFNDKGGYGGFRGGLETELTDGEKQELLESAGLIHFLHSIGITIAAVWLLMYLSRAAQAAEGVGKIALYAAIAAIAAFALYMLWLVDYDGNGHTIWEDMEDLYRVNEKLDASNWRSWGGWLRPLLGIFSGAIIAAAIWGNSMADWFGMSEDNWLSRRISNWAEGKMADAAVNEATKDVQQPKQ